MTINELRKYVKEKYPHIKITVKTLSFQDLARCSKKCLNISGDTCWQECKDINDKAEEMGIVPDGNVRCY